MGTDDVLELGSGHVRVCLYHQRGYSCHQRRGHAGAGLAGVTVLGGCIRGHDVRAYRGHIGLHSQIGGVASAAVDGEAEVLVESGDGDGQSSVAGAVNGVAAGESGAAELIARGQRGDDACLDHHVHLAAPGRVAVVIDVSLELLLAERGGEDVDTMTSRGILVVDSPLGTLHDILDIAVAAR